MTHLYPRLAAACLLGVAPVGCTESAGPDPVVALFSFEEGMDGWTVEGLDLDDPAVTWSIGRSNDRATDGGWSVRYELANYNDAGKIWIRCEFMVAPGKYQVELGFRFASRDFGTANLWTIIAGATSAAPTQAADLPFRGHTGTGADVDAGWVWLSKQYTDSLEVGPSGVLHVVVGVWGTWETPRTYYVDQVEVRITAGTVPQRRVVQRGPVTG